MLKPTAFYKNKLEQLHRKLLDHPITKEYLTGKAIRYDGIELDPYEEDVYLEIEGLTALEFSHLFSVFNGSRVHAQMVNEWSPDDAPPGFYVNVINGQVIQGKNKTVVFREEDEDSDLFIETLHIDHFFLLERKTVAGLGTVAFSLCAITAHLAGFAHIKLIAAGGKGANPKHIGYRFWPKLGFNADLERDETLGTPHLSNCRTVQDVIEHDEGWWHANGTQRLVTFDLRPNSLSWQKLLSYLVEKMDSGADNG